MPRTPLNSAISGHRVYATASLPLAQVKALAKSCGVTINDVVLAACAGALRRYLAAALPEKPLTAGVPASLRPPGDAHLNNQVVFTLSRLPTDVAEPLQRLAAAQAAGQEAKNLFADMRDLIPTDISILGAPLVVTGLARLWGHARASNYLGPFFNIVISNVPGPRQTMYCAGAPATHSFPVSVPYHGCALNITAQSYLDQLDFGLIACSETVPQAQRIADFIVEDFAAMCSELSRLQAIETIAVARPAPVAAHKPIEVGEARAEARPRKAEKASTLAQQHRRACRRDRGLAPPDREGSAARASDDAHGRGENAAAPKARGIEAERKKASLGQGGSAAILSRHVRLEQQIAVTLSRLICAETRLEAVFGFSGFMGFLKIESKNIGLPPQLPSEYKRQAVRTASGLAKQMDRFRPSLRSTFAKNWRHRIDATAMSGSSCTSRGPIRKL